MAELEAMACARPVVTWFNELHAYAEPPPYLTAVDSVEIAAAVATLYDSPELRASLGEKGRAWVEQHHGLERVVTRVEEVAKAIVEGGAIPQAPAA